MISEYHRPKTLQEAISLLQRPSPVTVPIGGGSSFTHDNRESVAVVDLQDLHLTDIKSDSGFLRVGASAKLQALLMDGNTPVWLRHAIERDWFLNQRNQCTVAGAVVTCSSLSVSIAALMAVDSRMLWEPEALEITMGEWSKSARHDQRGKIITELLIPLQPDLKWESIGRTPKDRPFLTIATSRWPSGRTRISAGGFGRFPTVIFDGSEDNGAEIVVGEYLLHQEDDFASGEYRSELGKTLVKRMLSK